MVSIELGDMETIAKKHLPLFENNLSKFLRHTIQYYDQQTKKQKTRTKKQNLLQYSIFITLGISLILFSISTLTGIYTILAPLLILLSGILLLVFMLIIGMETIRATGWFRWT